MDFEALKLSKIRSGFLDLAEQFLVWSRAKALASKMAYFDRMKVWAQVPDEPFRNFRASKSVDRRIYVFQERRAKYFKALKS